MQTTSLNNIVKLTHPPVCKGAAIFVLFGVTAVFAQLVRGASICNDPARTVVTQSFGPITPHQGPRLLVNPLNANGTSALTVLSMGDSAMWGNGLDKEHKYSHMVARHLAEVTQRSVTLIVYAHSGANLSTEAGQSYEPMRPSDNGVPPGDPNAGLPTVLQQEACAKKDYSQAEIILLDGCINDVSALAIGLPFPFSGATPDAIRRRANLQCSEPVKTLLRNVKDDFPKATIILSNYWLIISDKSSPAGVTVEKGIIRATSADPVLNKEYENLLYAQRKAEQETGQNFAAADLLSDPAHIFRKWSDNSQAFLVTSQDCFVSAIATVNGQSVDKPCSHLDPAMAQRVTQDLRVFLATVSVEPQYSYGAGPLKRVWSVPIGRHRQDQEYDRRRVVCDTHYPIGGKRFICQINPTAHPNVDGAKAFTDSMNSVLDVAWKVQ